MWTRTSGWKLFDIERQEFIIAEYYENIEPYVNNVIRLQNDSCCHYMMYKDLYYCDSEAKQYIITDTIPR